MTDNSGQAGSFLRRMRGALLGLAVLAAAPVVAEAQYGGAICVTPRGNCSASYQTPGGGCYCNIPGFGRKAGQIQMVDRPYRPRMREYREYEDEGFRPRPRRREFGSVCVTSRGDCGVGRPVPLGSGCYCHIPGFGRKAGNVRY